MNRYSLFGFFLILLLIVSVQSTSAKQKHMSVEEFVEAYNSLLAGKTLVTESVADGVTTNKVRNYGQPNKLANGNYEIPVEIVITVSENGVMDQRFTLKVVDKVIDHGGVAIITDEVVETKREVSGLEPVISDDEEFNGSFVVTKNKKGGFDVWSFSMVPSVISDDNMTDLRLGGSMAHYSCYPENGLTNCVLTIKDYEIDNYKPMKGFKKKKAHGGELVEISKELQSDS